MVNEMILTVAGGNVKLGPRIPCLNRSLLTMKLRLLALSIAALSVYGSETELRTWTNTAGQTLEARLINAADGSVTIERADGQEFTLSLSTLSSADGDYVKEWQAVQSAPKPVMEALMATTGKLIYSDSFSEIGGEWRTSKGEWKAVEGALSGMELEADDHAAVMKKAMPVKDVVVEFSVKLGDTKNMSFSMDDAKDHVCRVSVTPAGFQARKDDNDHEGPDVAKPFNNVASKLDPEEWHTVRVEILGDQMVAQVGEDVSMGSDPLLATEKAKWGFTVAGGPVMIKDLKVWEARPNEGWESAARRLKRKLGIDD